MPIIAYNLCSPEQAGLYTKHAANARASSKHSSRIDCDVIEAEDGMVVRADLPGLAKESISISIEKNVLTIEADASVPPSPDASTMDANVRHIMKERVHGKVSRSFRLPDRVDVDSAKCTFENGTVSIAFAKAASQTPRKLEIQ